ncbi:MAG: arginase family protein [Candidatus ainarchaeum sp.]|nr:arginase family protein [Candidatus ainarchaeum sp.]
MVLKNKTLKIIKKNKNINDNFLNKNIIFLNLPKKYCSKKDSMINIIPIKYKGKVTVGSGAEKGPLEILKASYELEYFDCELNFEPYLYGIYTYPFFNFQKHNNYILDLQSMLDTLSKNVSLDKFNIFLGSDHSTTISVVSFLEQKHLDFGIIVFDAHSDLREPWGEDTWLHACTSRIISKKHETVIFGVRSQDFYEHMFLESKDGKNINIVYAKDLFKNPKFLDLYLKKLPKHVFISIDVDFFDPSIIKYTNTPEPGGFNWNQINFFLEKIFKRKNVIALDLVEFAPNGEKKDYFSESYTLAKLVYKICAYKIKF